MFVQKIVEKRTKNQCPGEIYIFCFIILFFISKRKSAAFKKLLFFAYFCLKIQKSYETDNVEFTWTKIFC